MPSFPLVGFVAPSSVVPPHEFEKGLERLENAGLSFQVHPQCKKKWLFFAGTDEERARALIEYAYDSNIEAVWCARGGYGSYRLLPWLERETQKRGKPPKKIILGYSDATCLLDFAREHWGWSALHSPMPGLMNFLDLGKPEFGALLDWLRGEQPQKPFGGKPLKFAGPAPTNSIEGEMVGGNLSTLLSMTGSPFATKLSRRILFLEDVGETLSRLDRMVQQLFLQPDAQELLAIVLGDFKDCNDVVRPMQVKPSGRSKKPVMKPSRAAVSPKLFQKEVWGSMSECFKIPIAYGLPVGHGPGKFSLPLGARYRLSPDGRLELLEWTGLRGQA